MRTYRRSRRFGRQRWRSKMPAAMRSERRGSPKSAAWRRAISKAPGGRRPMPKARSQMRRRDSRRRETARLHDGTRAVRRNLELPGRHGWRRGARRHGALHGCRSAEHAARGERAGRRAGASARRHAGRFTVNGFARRFVGRITRIKPVADPATRQVQIIASVPNAEQPLVGGLFAEGRVATECAAGARRAARGDRQARHHAGRACGSRAGRSSG